MPLQPVEEATPEQSNKEERAAKEKELQHTIANISGYPLPH